MSSRVVIIGGGPSAKHAAELMAKDKSVKVTVVQASPFVEWSVAMADVLVRPAKHDRALASDCAKFQVPGVEYRYAVAKSVDPEGKQVVLMDDTAIPYDALIVATGFRVPLVYPALGASLAERKEEIRRVGAAIQRARCVVVAGGGPIGLEIAGNIRLDYPDTRVVLVTRDRILSAWPEEKRARVEALLKARNIEVLAGSSGAPDFSLEPGSLTLNGQQLQYDVYLPAYSQGPNTKFLEGARDVLDARGYMKVNSLLQCKAYGAIFGIGVTDAPASFIGLPKLEAQWNSVTANVRSMLAGKAMQVHKEGMPFMKLPVVLLVGHGKGGYGYFDFDNAPPPLRCCCCCGLGGFPCCPTICCWPCCGPCPCGYCFGPPEGEGLAKLMGTMAFKFAGFHFKGVGEAPKQQTMA